MSRLILAQYRTVISYNLSWTNRLKCCPTSCTSFLSKRKNTVPQWAFKLNSALATAYTWDLRGCMLLKDNKTIEVWSKMLQFHCTLCMFNIHKSWWWLSCLGWDTITGWVGPDVMKDHGAFIIRVKQSKTKHSSLIAWPCGWMHCHSSKRWKPLN